MIKLAVPKERHENESRVSVTPDCVSSLKKIGFEVYSIGKTTKKK